MDISFVTLSAKTNETRFSKCGTKLVRAVETRIKYLSVSEKFKIKWNLPFGLRWYHLINVQVPRPSNLSLGEKWKNLKFWFIRVSLPRNLHHYTMLQRHFSCFDAMKGLVTFFPTLQFEIRLHSKADSSKLFWLSKFVNKFAKTRKFCWYFTLVFIDLSEALIETYHS